jgi:MFS superfamily sulfate permease-like transporter
LGNVHRETRILGLSNIIAGCCGGLPICINLFGTYENYAFNKRFGFNGTKLVGLLQVGVSFLLYSVLKFAYNMIPLFILFTVAATPMIYFLKNIFEIHYRNVIFIVVLASINVLTHPIIGLIVASYLSVYEIAGLLRAAPAEILM